MVTLNKKKKIKARKKQKKQLNKKVKVGKVKAILKVFGIGLVSAISFNLFILLLLNSKLVKSHITKYFNKIYHKITRTDPLYKGARLIIDYSNQFIETSKLAFKYLNPQVLLQNIRNSISNNETPHMLDKRLLLSLRDQGIIYVNGMVYFLYSGIRESIQHVINEVPKTYPNQRLPGAWPGEYQYSNVSETQIREITNINQTPESFFSRISQLNFF